MRTTPKSHCLKPVDGNKDGSHAEVDSGSGVGAVGGGDGDLAAAGENDAEGGSRAGDGGLDDDLLVLLDDFLIDVFIDNLIVNNLLVDYLLVGNVFLNNVLIDNIFLDDLLVDVFLILNNLFLLDDLLLLDTLRARRGRRGRRRGMRVRVVGAVDDLGRALLDNLDNRLGSGLLVGQLLEKLILVTVLFTEVATLLLRLDLRQDLRNGSGAALDRTGADGGHRSREHSMGASGEADADNELEDRHGSEWAERDLEVATGDGEGLS